MTDTPNATNTRWALTPNGPTLTLRCVDCVGYRRLFPIDAMGIRQANLAMANHDQFHRMLTGVAS